MKKTKKHTFLGRKGFSLMELMITTGIFSAIVLVTLDVSKNITKEITNINERADVVLDYAGVFKIVNDDVLNSVPSFNYLNSTKQQNQGNDFWTVWDQDSGARSLTIKKDQSCFSVLVIDISKTIDINNGTFTRLQTLLPNPSYFYKPRTSMSDPLIYDSTKLKQLLEDNNLNFEDQLLKISGMMPVYSNGGYYKDYGIILKVDSNGNPIPNANIIPTYSPPTSCNGVLSSVDKFLRCLPTPSGGVSNFYITPVEYISYCLRKNNDKKGLELYRKKDNSENLIATNLKSIKLVRSISSNPIINIEINFCEPNDNSGVCN
ncbi:MAG: prepilin-type N-terminal cleavage/methylation domain-containing protein [Bacteriovoracaceae bacterium]|nr:prepilin-type N-terminal cleavage/methylation domain-containing protein [Bacteriovoracaceae bacterium]